MNHSSNQAPQLCTQNVGDVELSYLLDEGDGSPLILLNAAGFLPWLWHPLARELSVVYRIITPYFHYSPRQE